MKKLKYIIFSFLLLAAFISCQQEKYMLYESASFLQFGPRQGIVYSSGYITSRLADTVKSYTFYYENPTKLEEVVNFDLYAIGIKKDHDRKITLRQIQVEGKSNAIAGKHYKAFDSKEMESVYVIQKDSVHLLLPIVMLRDPSLKQSDVVLRFEIVENNEFKVGEKLLSWRQLTFGDVLQQPAAWNASATSYHYGAYSLTKHKWMIEITGEKWDQEFMSFVSANSALQYYWKDFFKNELIKKNNALLAENKEEFKDEFNNKIVFP